MQVKDILLPFLRQLSQGEDDGKRSILQTLITAFFPQKKGNLKNLTTWSDSEYTEVHKIAFAFATMFLWHIKGPVFC